MPATPGLCRRHDGASSPPLPPPSQKNKISLYEIFWASYGHVLQFRPAEQPVPSPDRSQPPLRVSPRGHEPPSSAVPGCPRPLCGDRSQGLSVHVRPRLICKPWQKLAPEEGGAGSPARAKAGGEQEGGGGAWSPCEAQPQTGEDWGERVALCPPEDRVMMGLALGCRFCLPTGKGYLLPGDLSDSSASCCKVLSLRPNPPCLQAAGGSEGCSGSGFHLPTSPRGQVKAFLGGT